MLHLRPNDLSEILSSLNLGNGAAPGNCSDGKLEYLQFFEATGIPGGDSEHTRLIEQVKLFFFIKRRKYIIFFSFH